MDFSVVTSDLRWGNEPVASMESSREVKTRLEKGL